MRTRTLSVRGRRLTIAPSEDTSQGLFGVLWRREPADTAAPNLTVGVGRRIVTVHVAPVIDVDQAERRSQWEQAIEPVDGDVP